MNALALAFGADTLCQEEVGETTWTACVVFSRAPALYFIQGVRVRLCGEHSIFATYLPLVPAHIVTIPQRLIVGNSLRVKPEPLQCCTLIQG
jgi:hypothetical protein